MEALACNHCCSGKLECITQPVCVFEALVNRHAMRMRHIAINGLPHSTIFLHILSQTSQFSKNVTEHTKCVLIPSTTFVRNIFHSKKK
jgi:hypothetical protein